MATALTLILIFIVGYLKLMSTVQEILDSVAALKTDVQALKDKPVGPATQEQLDSIAAAIADVHTLATS